MTLFNDLTELWIFVTCQNCIDPPKSRIHAKAVQLFRNPIQLIDEDAYAYTDRLCWQEQDTLPRARDPLPEL